MAAYRYDYSSFLVTVIKSQSGTLQAITRNEGNAAVLGIEGSLRYAFAKRYSIFGNYGYLDAKFDETENQGNEQELDGNKFRLTPKHPFSMGIVGNGGIFIRPSYTYKSQVFFEEENQVGIEQERYGLLNTRIGY